MLTADLDASTIPPFLDAKLRPRRRRVREDSGWAPTKKLEPPDVDSWPFAVLETQRHALHLHDEVPAIGSGIRDVWVAIGRKSIGLLSAEGRAVIRREKRDGTKEGLARYSKRTDAA